MKQSEPLAFLDAKLADLRERGELRDAQSDAPTAPFGTNDYLGLASPKLPGAARGATGSRLLGGDSPSHRALEAELAAWLGLPAALLFGSGYAANVGALSALVSPGDLVLSDERNHASLIDGIRLARVKAVIAPHNDLAFLTARLEEFAAATSRAASPAAPTGRAWIVTESYFSMDADGADPSELRALATRHDALLYVDEAHALGVFGPNGRGRFAEAGVAPDVLIGTFGKAFGSVGALVAGSQSLRTWLWNRARSFVFSTAAPPDTIEALRRTLPQLRDADAARAHLAALSDQLRDGLIKAGARVLGFGPIVPVLIGRTAAAVECAQMLADAGLSVRPVRPPTVAPGTARLRLAVRADQTADDIESALVIFRRLPWARWS